MKIRLDMDGVLVDIVRGLCKLHGRPRPDWGEDTKSLQKAWNISSRDLHETASRSFWANLAWMYDGTMILELVENKCGVENIYIATATVSAEACAGKWDWIEHHIPRYLDRLIQIKPKAELAQRDTLLIDDFDDNVNAYREAGGKAILVPRPWNSDRKNADVAYLSVQRQLQEYLDDE